MPLQSQKNDPILDIMNPSNSVPETQTGHQPGKLENSSQMVAQKTPKKPVGLKRAYVPPVFVVILFSVFGYFYFFGENHAPYRNLKAYLGQTLDRYIGPTSETSAPKPGETAIKQSNIAGAQVQALNLKTQNTSNENQSAQLISNNEGLRATLEELKGAKERVVELEREVAMIDTMLSQSQLKIARLSKELKLENHKEEVLGSELSSKVDLIAELQEKLEDSQSNALKAETKIENSNKKINKLKENLLNLKKEKASTETQFGQLKASYAGLSADIQELKGAKDRVAELESAAAVREQTLTLTKPQVADLTAALEQEKKAREQLRNELSTKADRLAELEQKLTAALTRRAELENDVKIGNSKVAEFQQKLQTSQTDQQVLQAAIEKREKEIAVLQNQLKGPEAQPAPTVSSTVSEIADLKDQLLDLKAQKTAADARLSELKSSNDMLATDLEEFKGLKELVSALEGELAARDQVISSSEQQLSHLANELDQEKKSGERLRSELSSKAALTAELQEKFETSQTKALDFETQIKNNEVKIKTLQDKLLEFKAEKANFDSQLGQLKSRNAGLSSDLKESKGVKERVAELESAVAMREQTLGQSEQKIKDLTVALEQEKKGREQLKNELSTKADGMTELEHKLAAALSSRAELENEFKLGKSKIVKFQQQLQTSQTNQQMLQATIEKSQKEIVALQNQLKGFEAQQIPVKPLPGVAELPKKTAPPRDVVKDQGLPPNPSHIIDWVLKKKAK